MYDVDKNLANVLDIDIIPTIKQVKFSITFDSDISKVIYLGQKYEIAFISDAGTFYFLRYNYFQNRMHLISKLRNGIRHSSYFINIYRQGFKHKDCFVYLGGEWPDYSIVFYNYKKN